MPADWRAAFLAVPREMFVPDRIWTRGAGSYTPLSRQADPQGWRAAIYRDEAITTQVDDGAAGHEPSRYPTSSCSMPSVVARMLDELDAAEGMRMLEIGTGTGWNAAILAARLGDEQVTTVEVDAGIAEDARRALAGAGFSPQVVVGDGAAGYPPRAPYDRVIATCAVRTVPYAWVAQTRPGGRIITPWGNAYHNGVLLRLDVGDGVASGPVVGTAGFMWLRAQRLPFDWLADHADDTLTYDETHTDLDPRQVHPSFAVGVQVPECHYLLDDDNPDQVQVWLFHPASNSRAVVFAEPGAHTFPVRQYGPRRLWDEVEAAHTWWVDAGRPDHTRFGLTVTPDDQWTWLDTPDHRVGRREPYHLRPHESAVRPGFDPAGFNRLTDELDDQGIVGRTFRT